jgi:hypothetical protein
MEASPSTVRQATARAPGPEAYRTLPALLDPRKCLHALLRAPATLGDTVLSNKTGAFRALSGTRIPYSPTNARPYQLPTFDCGRNTEEGRISRRTPVFEEAARRCDTVPSDKNSLKRAAFKYRTSRQRNTVLSDKRLPYRPTNTRFFGHPSGAWTSHTSQNILQKRYFDCTWFSIRRYRTPWQGMPYPRTNITVPSGKGYRTVQQGIPYRPTSFAVLRHKTWRTLPQE